MPFSPQAAGCKALRATALGTLPSSGAHRPNPVLPTPSPGATALKLPRPRWPARVPLPRRGCRRTFSPVSPHQPAGNGGACFPITPHNTPARSGRRRPGKAPPFLTPLGSRPTSPLHLPLQVPRPPRLNLVQEMQPAPCPGLPGLFPAPSAPPLPPSPPVRASAPGLLPSPLA